MNYALVPMLFAAMLFPVTAAAGEPAPATELTSPLTEHQRGLYRSIGKILVASVERMPEARLGYRPTEEVRTFAEIVGHAAAAQYFFCGPLRAEKGAGKFDAGSASKAELIAAVEAAFAYCDGAYAGLTDATGAAPVKFMNDEKPKLGVLGINNLHLMEHYGNLITYMRMNGVVPPTSDPEFMKTLD